jgi:hypothetical protein
MDKKTYEGEIIFKTEKLEVKSTLEMIIKTGDEKEKIFKEGEEEEADDSDIGFTHSSEQEEKKEKIKKRNIFGVEEDVEVKKKKDANKEGEKGSSKKEAGKPKEEQEQHRAPMMRTAQQPEMEMASRDVPPTLKTTPPLTTSARSPKQAKLLKPKDKKEKAE